MTTVDLHDVNRVRRATGLLAAFNDAGVLGAADVHVATRLGQLVREQSEPVLLAVALAVRAVRLGSVCLELADAHTTTAVEGLAQEDLAALPWPEPAAWVTALDDSDLVGDGTDADPDRPLRLVEGDLYLDRYWRQEQIIAIAVDHAESRTAPVLDTERLQAAAYRLFASNQPDRQRLAAMITALRWVSILAGGPGTGKTTTVAKLMALLQDQPGLQLRIALAAPTGKAAARLSEAVTEAARFLGDVDRDRLGDLKAFTLHRLLGFKPGARTRFWHDRDNRLPYDVVIVDEASMVSLTMMSRLVDALRHDTRLVLVGDPDQLASIEAGAVLGDLVQRPAPPSVSEDAELAELVATDLADLDEEEKSRTLTAGVVRLRHVFRFSDEINALAGAIRSGEPSHVLDVLARKSASIEYVEGDPATSGGLEGVRSDVVDPGEALVGAARRGDAAQALAVLNRHRLLCAHREGPYGVRQWSRLAEEWLGEVIDGYASDGLWYVGRPLLVTSNDYQLRLFNGDTGVVVDVNGSPRAAFVRDGDLVLLPTSRLSDVQTVHAMSVHRSQGSQFDRVTLVLPRADSPLLTRELLYTAITRAKEHVRIVGTPEALAMAVRRSIVRASGLRKRR
ncbi:MAG: exodeoxyribonuclease V subunit alpha [Actinomycetota bacterium]|nr:exodeoxyribonuclease V subunit alpha [Actinomycetota bacterium]